ncbi:MAG: hypothetical protein QMC90_01600 [Dehalococcoidales bacterium]|nr:hypothetical protein [Dehalococcoidales bacterium]
MDCQGVDASWVVVSNPVLAEIKALILLNEPSLGRRYIIGCIVRGGRLDGIFTNVRQQRSKIYLLTGVCAIVGCIILAYFGALLMLVFIFSVWFRSILRQIY